MIYLDNAATTLPKPPEVIRAVVRAMGTLGNASRGGHAAALAASRTVYEARRRAASLFGCPRADHVAFTCNATEALDTAVLGAVPSGSHVISTDLEHNSVLRPLHRLEDEGRISLSYVPADRDGRLDMDAFRRLLRPDTRAVVCAHASNVTGDAVDLARIGALARERGILLIVDAAQTAGHLPIDMEAMGIDILCFTGHKGLMGPQGTGGLCVREGVGIAPLKEGGSGIGSYLRRQPEGMPDRLEAGTLNVHGIAGLSAALDLILETGVEAVAAREDALARRFGEEASRIGGVTVYGDLSREGRAPIVALNAGDLSSGETADVLDRVYGIAVRPGAHCAPRMHRALGTEERGVVRFSFSRYNTDEDVDAALAALREIAGS